MVRPWGCPQLRSDLAIRLQHTKGNQRPAHTKDQVGRSRAPQRYPEQSFQSCNPKQSPDYRPLSRRQQVTRGTGSPPATRLRLHRETGYYRQNPPFDRSKAAIPAGSISHSEALHFGERDPSSGEPFPIPFLGQTSTFGSHPPIVETHRNPLVLGHVHRHLVPQPAFPCATAPRTSTSACPHVSI